MTDQRLHAYIELNADAPLEETARKVELAIDGLRLNKDLSGRYEEYEPFAGGLLGLVFALLGKGHWHDRYELQIDTDREVSGDYQAVDISNHVVGLLRNAGIECKELNP